MKCSYLKECRESGKTDQEQCNDEVSISTTERLGHETGGEHREDGVRRQDVAHVVGEEHYIQDEVHQDDGAHRRQRRSAGVDVVNAPLVDRSDGQVDDRQQNGPRQEHAQRIEHDHVVGSQLGGVAQSAQVGGVEVVTPDGEYQSHGRQYGNSEQDQGGPPELFHRPQDDPADQSEQTQTERQVDGKWYKRWPKVEVSA